MSERSSVSQNQTLQVFSAAHSAQMGATTETEEEDYQLALRLQREFDEQERLATLMHEHQQPRKPAKAVGKGRNRHYRQYVVQDDYEDAEEYSYDDDAPYAEEESDNATYSHQPGFEGEAEEAEPVEAELLDDKTTLDADYALALALQAEFASTAPTRGSPYRADANEKGTISGTALRRVWVAG